MCSMISSQCDELRNLALWLDDEFYDAEASKVRQAADTILELRGDLQRANEAVQNAEHDESMAWDRVRKAEAENAKLREQIYWLKHGDVLYVLTDQELADQQKHEREVQASITALESENAKLRRLVRTYRACHDHVDACRGCSELPDCEALEKMRNIGREVGIEVD